MIRYYLTCRSLTYAQRTSRALDAARIHNTVARTTQGMSAEGCGYAVVIWDKTLLSALDVLNKSGLLPKKAFAVSENGQIEEVAF